MPFAVEEFHDLIRLLQERPEWRADLRRLVLTDELLALPALVGQLVEAQQRTEARLAELAEAQRQTAAAVKELAEAQARTDGRLARLEEIAAAQQEQLARLETIATAHERRLDRMDTKLSALQGGDLERRLRDRAAAYLGTIMRRVYVLPSSELAELLEDAADDGAITEAERVDILRADLVARGRRMPDRQEVWLVMEVSMTVEPTDVERAVRRAGSLAKRYPAVPAVAGERITADAARQVAEQRVWTVIDGHATAV